MKKIIIVIAVLIVGCTNEGKKIRISDPRDTAVWDASGNLTVLTPCDTVYIHDTIYKTIYRGKNTNIRNAENVNIGQ